MTTQSAVRACFTFTISRLFGRYGPTSFFATTPSRPAPSNASNHSMAVALDSVAAVTWQLGPPPMVSTSCARRTEKSSRLRSRSPRASRSNATNWAGVFSDSIVTRLSAG